MKLPLNFLPNDIPKSKFDSATQSQIDAGGSGNSSVKAVTSQAELVAVLTGTQKELSIQADFTLTSNITIPDGAVLSDGGGKITVSTFDITFVNNSFKSGYLRPFINIGVSGTINDASTFNHVDIDISWFGVVFDYDHSTGVGTDNFNTLRQVFKIPNLNGGGKITALKDGAFAHLPKTKETYSYSIPTGVYMTGKTHFIMGKKTIYQALGNGLDGTRGFTVYNTEDALVEGGLFRGDGRYWHTRETLETNHGGSHGVMIKGKNLYLKFKSSISEWEGDCLIGKTDYRAVHSSAGGNEGISEFNFQTAQGGLLNTAIDMDGIESVSSQTQTSKLFDIAGTLLETYGELLIGGNYAYQGENGFGTNSCYISFYDINDNFIERTNTVDIFSSIPLKSTYKKCRVSLINPTLSSLDGTIFAIRNSKGIEITSPSISYGMRQGMSNMQSYTTLRNVNFINNGRRDDGYTSSPSFGVDLEDGYQMLNNINFIECQFDNNALGSVILKGTKYVKFTSCSVNYNTFGEATNFTPATRRSFSTANGHFTLVDGNSFKDVDITSGRYDNYLGNLIFDTTFYVSFEGETIKDNIFHNCGIQATKDGSVSTGLTYVENNIQHFNRDNGSGMFFNRGNFVIKNHIQDFHGTKAEGISAASDTYVGEGFIDGFYVLDIDVSGNETGVNMNLPSVDVNDFQSPLTFGTYRCGGARDCKLSNSAFAIFVVRPLDYPSTNTGDFYTFTFENNEFITPNGNYISGGNSTFRTYASDYNVVVKNTKIWNEETTLDGQSIFDLKHYGIAYFDNCVIGSGDVHALDLTSETCDTITFLNCDFGANITGISLRVGDKLLFTEPNRLAPTFADNTTALAALGAGYYYKLTGTGEFKITY